VHAEQNTWAYEDKVTGDLMVKGKVEAVPLHAIRAYRVSKGVAVLGLIISAR
jgi:hypothetical protein